MTFEEYFSNSKSEIESHLRKIIRERNNLEIPNSLDDLNLLPEIEDFALRGKFLRGTLFLLTCQILGQNITDENLSIAVSIELVHSALLMQDDIIDNDNLRRGKPTVFAKYETRGREIKVTDPLHYGRSMAIVASDVCIFLAYEILSQIKNKNTPEMLKCFSREIYLTALAEGLDTELGQIYREATKEDILSVYRYKTARYTFSMAFLMGCIYSNADEDTKKILDEIGEKAGIIFQLKDDEMGFFGEEKDIGKPVGSDIRENKKTLLRYFLFNKASSDEKNKLDEYFGNSRLSTEQIAEVRLLAEKYGILRESEKYIDSNMKEIDILFTSISIKNEYMDILKKLLIYNLKRTS